MMNTSITSNAMLNSVIHKTLEKSIEAIGLPALEQRVFEREIQRFVQNGKGHPLGAINQENEKSRNRLWKAILTSRIVVAEVWNHDTQVFYCRTRAQGFSIDFRLGVKDHVWHLESFTLVDRPLRRWQTPWSLGAASVCALVLAAFVGYWMHPEASARSLAPGGNEVAAQSSEAPVQIPSNGTNATSSETNAIKTPASGTTGTGTTGTSAEKVGGNAKQDAATRSVPKKISLTLSSGMSLYDFAKQLASQHLVPDAMSFDMNMKNSGVDKDLKPGTYVFQSGMTVNQLLAVLRKGPAK